MPKSICEANLRWILACYWNGVNSNENGTKEGWNKKAFGWPMLVATKNVPKTIYASKTIGEKTIS